MTPEYNMHYYQLLEYSDFNGTKDENQGYKQIDFNDPLFNDD